MSGCGAGVERRRGALPDLCARGSRGACPCSGAHRARVAGAL